MVNKTDSSSISPNTRLDHDMVKVTRDLGGNGQKLTSGLEFIRYVTNHISKVESIVSNRTNSAEMRIVGNVNKGNIFSHLLLNTKGIDLRLHPGKVERFSLKRIGDQEYSAEHYYKNECIHKMILHSEEKLSEEIISLNSQGVNPIQKDLNETEPGNVLIKKWKDMEDPHHSSLVLQQLNINRTEAYTLLEKKYTQPINVNQLSYFLNELQQKSYKFKAFIGNDSVTQIYTEKIDFLVKGEQQIEIHGETGEKNKALITINTNQLDKAWIVKKNNITSLEFFDKEDNSVIGFYDDRNGNESQSKEWDNIINSFKEKSKICTIL